MSECHCGNDQLILKLEKGEEIVEILTKFFDSNNIEGGWLSGLGAISQATLASYDLDKKQYNRQEYGGCYELVSLNGNVAKLGDKTVLHLHAVISDHKMNTFGGHLDRAIVAATCEIFLTPTDRINRKYNKEIGLNLIS